MQKVYAFIVTVCLCLSSYAQITQPPQPTTGPGSNNPLYSGVTLYDYGTNANADGFWLFEPSGPVPDSANVVVFIHGWGETNLEYYGAFIDRIIRAGNIVICPRYQKTADTAYSSYTDSCARGIQRALDTLQQPGHVKPRLNNFFILGHSMGGVLPANLTVRYTQYNLPRPTAVISMEPGAYLPGLVLDTAEYANFPADIPYLIIIGNDDDVVDSTTGKFLFYYTTAVPTTHKNLVRQFSDSLGTPPLSSTHFEPLSVDTSNSIYNNGEVTLATIVSPLVPPDAVDFYCYWKLWDALYNCALNGTDCDVAFGDTPQQRFMGDWSNGTPVVPLLIIPSSTSAITTTGKMFAAGIYPNPAPGNAFQLHVSGVEDNPVFQLFDLNGQKITEQKITSASTTIHCNAAAGLYFYRIVNSLNEVVASGKLVKM